MRNGKKILTAMLFAGALCIGAASAASAANELTLYIGAPLLLADGAVKPLDSGNPGVVPIERSGRTLVPLRTIAEQFGATVSYEDATQTAIIQTDGKTYRFPVGQNSYTADGVSHPLDVGTMLLEDRSMVPLRAIAEQIFGRTVSYADNIIVIGNQPVALDTDAARCAQIREKIAGAVRPNTEWQLRAALQNTFTGLGGGMTSDTVTAEEGNTPEAPSADVGAGGDSSAESEKNDFSGTNLQEAGVDEGDLLKTDGKTLFYASDNALRIVRADTLEVLYNEMPLQDGDFYPNEMLLAQDRLVLIGSLSSDRVYYEDERDTVALNSYFYWRNSSTAALVFDVSDPAAPQLTRKIELSDQSLLTSRRIGNTVYLVSKQYIWTDRNDPYDKIVPCVRDGIAADAPFYPVALDDIFLCPGMPGVCYTTVSSFDLTDADAPIETESFLGDIDTVYMSENALYLAGSDYTYDPDGDNRTYTDLIKLALDDGALGFAAEGRITGTVLNQFSLGEYQGDLRIATNEWLWDKNDSRQINSVFVLNEQLALRGTVEDIAPDEQIYAVRFMGDTAYVVTYETVDPLFVIDLSNPDAPYVAGQLKVPGFSNYLHPVSDGMLLGIGRDTQEMFVREEDGSETVIGTRTAGIKVSLFDVTDPQHPRELDTLKFGTGNSYAPVLYDHRALLADEPLFGFALYEDWDEDAQAVLLRVENRKLNLLGQPNFTESGDGYYSGNERLCRIGNTVYALSDGGISAIDLTNLREVNHIAFS